MRNLKSPGLEALALDGVLSAQVELMDRFYFGIGTRRNFAKALQWAAAAAPRSAHAQTCLGHALQHGRGVAKDLRRALEWYKKAARAGDAQAQVYLGYAYDSGEGIAKSVRRAIFWYERAAAQGEANASYNLGQIYFERGEKGFSQAVSWWRKAAMRGHRKAQCNLAAAYENGTGLKANARHACHWYLKAIAQGDRLAQANLVRLRLRQTKSA
jgi:TPR repeat protein